LRGLAALTVVFSHYIPYWDMYAASIPVIVPNAVGHDAVKLFFVISGFVIFFTLDRCKTVADFAVLRFSRLYPTFWAALVLSTAVGVLGFGERFWAGGFVTNATMFHEFLGYGHLNNVYWSLTVELAFYLNAAWLFALGLHRRTHAVVLVWLAAAAAWIAWLRLSGSVPLAIPIDDQQRGWIALLTSLDFAPYFSLGILFYAVKRNGWTRGSLALMAFAIVVEFMLNLWEGLLVAGIACGLFALALQARLRFAVSVPTLWLGAISYSLYLLHRNLGYNGLSWLHEHGVGAVPAIALMTIAALAGATVLTYTVEQPASAFIRAWYKSRARRSGTETAVAAVSAAPADKDEVSLRS
jgi:peptidoglycan/LPS O-acetylase OafA/YrhL